MLTAFLEPCQVTATLLALHQTAKRYRRSCTSKPQVL